MKSHEYTISSNDDFQQMLGKWLNEKESLIEEKIGLDKLLKDKGISPQEYNVMYEDVMKRYESYQNPFYSADLSLAIQKGDVKHIEELRKYGAIFNIKDRNGNSPLMDAIQEGQSPDVIHALLDETDPNVVVAMINAQNNQHESALQWAARLGHAELVGLLLAKGANPNSRDINNNTPLLCACSAKKRDFVLIQALLDHGADANYRDIDKRTALHWASHHGDEELTKKLLCYGADPSMKDVNGNTPANVAALLFDTAHRTIALILEKILSFMPGKTTENQLNYMVMDEISKRGMGASGIHESIATRKQLTPAILRALVIQAAEHRNPNKKEPSVGTSTINIAAVINNILENNGPEKTKFLKESGVIDKICRCIKREVENSSVSEVDAIAISQNLMALNNGASRKQIANLCELGNVQVFINARQRGLKAVNKEKTKERKDSDHHLSYLFHKDAQKESHRKPGIRQRSDDAAKEIELKSVVGSNKNKSINNK